MRIGITGANGFIGSALTRRAAAAGWDVVGIVRNRPGLQYGRSSARMIKDPWSPDEWARVLTDVDCVVHLISRAHHTDEGEDAYDLYHRDNVGVSDALIEGLAGASVGKVVYLSSIKAVAERTTGSAIDASTLPAPTTIYGRTKLEAEERFVRWAASTSKDLVVLRPPLVYGPGVKGNFRMLLKLADSPILLPIGSIENRRSMIALDNLIDVILTGAGEGTRGVYRVPVADGEVLSTAAVITVLRAALGRSAGIYRFPERLLAAAARLMRADEQCRRISEDLVIDPRAVEIELGWRPPKTAIQSLVETAYWYSAPKA